jgi:hypothetical protein
MSRAVGSRSERGFVHLVDALRPAALREQRTIELRVRVFDSGRGAPRNSD